MGSNMSPAPSDRWSDDFLDTMRSVGDPVADSAVRRVYEQGLLGPSNQLLQLLVRNDQLPMNELPPGLRDYLHATSTLPPWADLAKIRRGEEIFGQYALQVVTALFCASLPSAYAARRGVQVLHRTARLETNPRRRIVETAQFVVDVMAHGGLEAGGAGVRDAQKVRLLHAAVRYLIGQSGQWDQAEFGLPVNQEDMAGTVLTFSHVVLESLGKLGVSLSSADEQAYLHVWNVIGHLLGVDERLLAHDMIQARELRTRIERRQFAPSPEGREQTQALLGLLEYVLPGTLFDGMPAMLVRYLGGNQVADLLGVPADVDWTRHLRGPAALDGRRGQPGRRGVASLRPALRAVQSQARGGALVRGAGPRARALPSPRRPAPGLTASGLSASLLPSFQPLPRPRSCRRARA